MMKISITREKLQEHSSLLKIFFRVTRLICIKLAKVYLREINICSNKGANPF